MGLFTKTQDETDRSADLPGQVADPTVVRDESVYEDNRLAAIRGGLTAQDKQRLDPASAFVAETARAKTGCTPYDPTANASDALDEARFQRALHRREVSDKSVKAAEERMRERERELADLGPEPPLPGLSRHAVAWVGGLALGPALYLGFHGFLGRSLPDLALAGAVLPALGAAGLVVAACVGTARPTPGRWRMWALSGVALALAGGTALGVNAGPLGSLGAAPGIAAVCFVCGVFVLVEVSARWLNKSLAERHEALRPWHAGAARVVQARQELSLRQSELTAIESEIAEHEQAVAQRTSVHLSGEEHAEVARLTVKAAETRGINDLDGWVWNGIRTVPRAHELRASHLSTPQDEESDR